MNSDGDTLRTATGCEKASFITVEEGDDLVVAYALALEEPGEIVSLILQRTPKYEFILPPEERGVAVSHELRPFDDHEYLKRIVVRGSEVEIETAASTYRVDVSEVEAAEISAAERVFRKMHRFGGFELEERRLEGPL